MAPLATFTCTEAATVNLLGSVIAEHTGDVGAISKESADHFVVGPGLGEVESAPGHKYTPIVNIPTRQTGGPAGEDFLRSEITEVGRTEPSGTLPSGREGVTDEKSEALMITPRGLVPAARLMAGEGFEPSKAEPRGLQPRPFDRSGTPPPAAQCR